MGLVVRAGSAATVVLLALLLGACGPEDRYVADPASSSAAAATAASPSDGTGPAVRVERPRILRCLHASTVPVEGEPSAPVPDPGTDLEPRFWLPLYVECEPGPSLLAEPPEPHGQSGTQPRP